MQSYVRHITFVVFVLTNAVLVKKRIENVKILYPFLVCEG